MSDRYLRATLPKREPTTTHRKGILMGKTYHGLEGLAEWRKDSGLPEETGKEARVHAQLQFSDPKNSNSNNGNRKKGTKPQNKKKGDKKAHKKEVQKTSKKKAKKITPRYDQLHDKLTEQQIAIQCPTHEGILDRGIRASIKLPGGKRETNIFFYCPKCKKLLFTTYKLPYGKTGRIYGIEAKNIYPPIYKKEDGKWKRVEMQTGVSPKRNNVNAVDAERAKKIRKKFNPCSDILYIHKGQIKCLQDKHDVISVTLTIPTEDDRVKGTVNANYCFDCDRFFMSLDEYNVYRKKNKIMLVRFQFLGAEFNDSYGEKWAEKSPLMLAGYSVAASKGFSDEKRKKILSKIMDNGIVEKHEIINYINFFISTKKHLPQNREAVEKWTRDLEFVRDYTIDRQHSKDIDTVRQYGR